MKTHTVLLVVSLLILTACVGTAPQTKEQAAALAQTNTGYQGVTLSFIANNPPDIVYTGNPLDIVVELKNQGAYPAVGTLYLTGYDPRMFSSIQPLYHTFNLEAKTQFNTFGGYDTISFSTGTTPIYLPQGTQILPQTFQASACYSYQTVASIPVCVNPNPNSVLAGQACDYTRSISTGVTGGQGAPVAVTSVAENAIPGQVGFQITVANQGTGQVIAMNSMANCPSPLGYNDVDIIQPYSVTLSGVAGDCKPDTQLILSNKQITFYCIFHLADKTSPAYQTLLQITLNYGYLTQVSKSINIRSLS